MAGPRSLLLLIVAICGCISWVAGVSSDPIIVVGAGMSGLGAALALAEQGFCNITVLEARNRTGGRTFTDYSLGASAEMGAGWVHGLKNNPVGERCTDAGIDVTAFSWQDGDMWNENGVIVPESDYTKIEDDYGALIEAVQKYADAQVPPRPVSRSRRATQPAGMRCEFGRIHPQQPAFASSLPFCTIEDSWAGPGCVPEQRDQRGPSRSHQ